MSCPTRSFAFDVTVSTHDLLREGVTEARLYMGEATHHRIVVGADSEAEAFLVAGQMASCQHQCTGVYLRV